MDNAKITIETLEKVEHITRLPICVTRATFVLPFEKKELKFGKVFQLQMLKDAAHGERMLGVWYCGANETLVEDRPPVGSIGCAAQVNNIKISKGGGKIAKVRGITRFRVVEYVETDKLYPVAEVEFFKDEPEPEELIQEIWLKTEETMWRILKKVTTMLGKPMVPPVHLPPAPLSFALCDLFWFGTDTKQLFLEMRKTSERLSAACERLAEWEENCDDITQRDKLVNFFKPNKDKPNLN